MNRFECAATVVLLVVMMSLGNVAEAQAPGSEAEWTMGMIALAAEERAKQRIQGVNYLVKRMESTMVPGPTPPGAGPCAMGGCVALKNENGEMRILTPTEVQVIAGLTEDSATLTAMGVGMIEGQLMMNDGMRAEIAAADPKLGMLANIMTEGGIGGAGLEPWANPFQMVGMGGAFVLAGAKALDDAADNIAQGAEIAQAQAEARRALMENGQHVGIVEHNGRQAHKFVVENINQTVEVDGGDTFTMKDITMLFDVDELVLLLHRTDGTARQGGDDVPFYIESESADFRNVPGTDLYEPYETISRMGGMLDDEQMAQMEEAKVQLEEFERQLAAMPANQRAMAEQMMGGQMEMMRGLVNTGTFEFKQKVLEIYVNPDLAALYGAAPAATGAGAMQAAPGGNLVARIQTDLEALGYDPGNVDGELSTQTVIAISQYQSEKGLDVNGEPSEALAARLAADLGR